MLAHHSDNIASIILKQLSGYLSNYDSSIYLVGGCLRDSFLNRPIHDLDLVTSLDPNAIGPEIAKHLHGTYIQLNSDPAIGRIIIKPVDDSNESCMDSMSDITGFTIDLSQLLEDITANLATRDFTVNSMALNIRDCQKPEWRDLILDPLNGITDLFAKKLRATSPSTFKDDPCRLLRSVRLSAQLGFLIEPQTAIHIKEHADLSNTVSPERIRDELLNILSRAGAMAQLNVLDRLGI